MSSLVCFSSQCRCREGKKKKEGSGWGLLYASEMLALASPPHLCLLFANVGPSSGVPTLGIGVSSRPIREGCRGRVFMSVVVVRGSSRHCRANRGHRRSHDWSHLRTPQPRSLGRSGRRFGLFLLLVLVVASAAAGALVASASSRRSRPWRRGAAFPTAKRQRPWRSRSGLASLR